MQLRDIRRVKFAPIVFIALVSCSPGEDSKSKADKALVYEGEVVCRDRLPTMSEAEAVVINKSNKTLRFKAHANFFSEEGVLIESVEGIYDYELRPGQKEVVRVTFLRNIPFPEVRKCSLSVRW